MRILDTTELKFVSGGAHLPPTASAAARRNSQDGRAVSARARDDVKGNPTA
jgi:hypothetical protein